MVQIAVKKLIVCFMHPVTENEPVIVSHDPVFSSAPYKHTGSHTLYNIKMATSISSESYGVYQQQDLVLASDWNNQF